MAFCTKCGKQIPDGTVCDCQATPVTPVAPVAPSVTPAFGNTQQTVSFFKTMIDTIIGIFKAPTTGAEEYIEKGNFGIALILFGLQAFFMAIYGVVANIRYAYAYSDAYLYGYVETSDVVVSCLKAGVLAVILTAAMGAAFAGLLWVANIICKTEMKFTQMLCAASLRCFFVVVFGLIAIVATLIQPYGGSDVLSYVNVLSYAFVVSALPRKNEMAKKFLPILSIAAIFVVLLISILIRSKVSGLFF